MTEDERQHFDNAKHAVKGHIEEYKNLLSTVNSK